MGQALPSDEPLERSEKAVSGYTGVTAHGDRWKVDDCQIGTTFATAVDVARARHDYLARKEPRLTSQRRQAQPEATGASAMDVEDEVTLALTLGRAVSRSTSSHT